MLDDLKATVDCEEKKGGGVYDLKITAKLKYNLDIYQDIYEIKGIYKINPERVYAPVPSTSTRISL